MKLFLKLLFGTMFLLYLNNVSAQNAKPAKMFRLYEENDFFNLRNRGTDKSYTNGTRIDFFYEQPATRGLLQRLMPKAGDSSKNVYGWSLMQVMLTPANITATNFQPDDYYYAGALFATHSLYSYNPQKKYSFQTELLAGIRGPESFAKQTQKGVHKLINDPVPKGWHNQLKTQPLINISLGFEKNLLSIGDFIELNAGSLLRAGSFMDLLMVYPMLRIGKMSPYFNGYMDQYGSSERNGKKIKTQYYFVVKPSLSFVAYDAMLTGERENKDDDNPPINEPDVSIHNSFTDIQFGIVVGHGKFAVSCLQTRSTAYREGLYKHTYGNLSLYFKW